MQDRRHRRHTINSRIGVTDRLWHRSETDHQPSLETLSEAPVGVLKNVLQLNQVTGAHEVLR